MYHCFFEGFAFIRSFIAFADNYIAQVNIADIISTLLYIGIVGLIISFMDVGQIFCLMPLFR